MPSRPTNTSSPTIKETDQADRDQRPRLRVTAAEGIALPAGATSRPLASLSLGQARATRRRLVIPADRAPHNRPAPPALAPTALTTAYPTPHWSVSSCASTASTGLSSMVPTLRSATIPSPLQQAYDGPGVEGQEGPFAFPVSAGASAPSGSGGTGIPSISSSGHTSNLDSKAGPSTEFASGGGPARATGIDQFVVHETFSPNASYRGQILLRADGLEWYVHEDILRFSAPFFHSLLSGEWSETEPLDDDQARNQDRTCKRDTPMANPQSDQESDPSDIFADFQGEDLSAESDLAVEHESAHERSNEQEQEHGPDQELEIQGTATLNVSDDIHAVPLDPEAHPCPRPIEPEQEALLRPAYVCSRSTSFTTAQVLSEEEEEQTPASVCLHRQGSNRNPQTIDGVNVRQAPTPVPVTVEGQQPSSSSPPSPPPLSPQTPSRSTAQNTPSSSQLRASEDTSTSSHDPPSANSLLQAGQNTPETTSVRPAPPKPVDLADELEARERLVALATPPGSIKDRDDTSPSDTATVTPHCPASHRDCRQECCQCQPSSSSCTPIIHKKEASSSSTRPVAPGTPRASGSSSQSHSLSTARGVVSERNTPHANARGRGGPLNLTLTCPRSPPGSIEEQPVGYSGTSSDPASSRAQPTSQRKEAQRAKAVIDFPDESALTIQEFLLFIYPHTKMSITWLSVGGLLAFSDKIGNTFLFQEACGFLRQSLAGRPIEAMRLAEKHHLHDVYREASRHVLDHWSDWDRDDVTTLSPRTLLKLERRRSWFLERLLKLSLSWPMRDFECHPRCPHPEVCARALQEKWQKNYRSCLLSGPPQPSTVWRLLRDGEETGLHAPFSAAVSGPSSVAGTSTSANAAFPAPAQTACALAAKSWRELLFDRMFSLPSLPHGPGMKVQKQFLCVRLDVEP